MTSRLIESYAFDEREWELMAEAFYKGESVIIKPSLHFLLNTGLIPDRDREGVLYVKDHSKPIQFSFIGKGKGCEIELKEKPGGMDDDDEKIVKTFTRIENSPRSHMNLGFVLNVPEFFDDEKFLAWLNNDSLKTTNHKRGEIPSEMTEVMLTLDPLLNGDGREFRDPDFPQWCKDIVNCEVRTVLRGDEKCTIRYIGILTNRRG